MSEQNASQARTVNTTERSGKADVSSLVLLAVLLAAGFILNMTVGNALAIVGIKPQFIIASYALAILLSDVMCATVAFSYCDMLWGIRYASYSAPASTAFLLVIPYAAAIAVCTALAVIFWRKSAKC